LSLKHTSNKLTVGKNDFKRANRDYSAIMSKPDWLPLAKEQLTIQTLRGTSFDHRP